MVEVEGRQGLAQAFDVPPLPYEERRVAVAPGGGEVFALAIDPTAPGRIAIGWRQFDSVTSNFRQAGHAYSADGGRTWTNALPLDPGVFASDPVLAASVGYVRGISLAEDRRVPPEKKSK